MLVPFVVAALAAIAPSPACADVARGATEAVAVDVAADSTLVALYAGGVDFAAFLASAQQRREQWLRHSDGAVVPADVLATARELPGHWRLLVTAIDGCSDSVNTIPYLAKLVALVPSLEMHIVLPGPGKPVMESHRTPDGRAATPTVVILDEAGNDMGCWVERPALLQAKAIDMRANGLGDQFAREKQAWYDTDAGASTVREVVAVLKSAAAGTPLCAAGR